MIDTRVNKKLEVNDRIIFIWDDSLIDGTIVEKNYIGDGDIDFVIKIGEDKTYRTKHRRLNLYHKF